MDCPLRLRLCSRPSSTLTVYYIHRDERSSAAPTISPGVVEDTEPLLREMFNPHHVVDGELLITAISIDDLRANGFSVHRMHHVTPELVKASMAERCLKPRKGRPWRNEGVARLQTRAVRYLRLNGARAFVVIDIAHESNPGHASIYAAHAGIDKAHARELQSLLLPLLQERMSVEDAFEQVAR